MDFAMTTEQNIWMETVNDLMDHKIGRDYCRQVDQERAFPKKVFESVVENGAIGLMIPEQYGGAGADAIMYAIFTEALAKYGMDIPGCVAMSMFTAMNIVHYGSEAQKTYYLPRFLKGQVKFSISITEPGAGSDVASVSTSAVLDGEHYVLNGQKTFASLAHLEDTVIFMAVRTSKAGKKHEGLSVLLVPNDLPGIEMRRMNTLARRSSGTNEIFLSDVRVPKENLLGPVNGGFKVLMKHLDLERVANAAGYVGVAQTAISDALKYAKQRVQFDRPISSFQVLKHMFADMQTQVEAARLMVYRAAWMLKEGLPCTKEVSMAKVFASEVYRKIAADGMQILGGYSMMPEYDMERFFRDSMQATIGGGTSQVQRTIIAREMGL